MQSNRTKPTLRRVIFNDRNMIMSHVMETLTTPSIVIGFLTIYCDCIRRVDRSVFDRTNISSFIFRAFRRWLRNAPVVFCACPFLVFFVTARFSSCIILISTGPIFNLVTVMEYIKQRIAEGLMDRGSFRRTEEHVKEERYCIVNKITNVTVFMKKKKVLK